MKHISKFLAIVLTLAMAIGLLTAIAVPASAVMECFVCEGVCFYQCSSCYGKGAYYYCPVHTEYHWDSLGVCDFCDDRPARLLQSPCDNGCLWNDDFGCYVTACTFCNGLGVILTRPDPPQNLVLTPGDKKITMTWEAPDDDGGSPITGYKVLCIINDDENDVTLGPDVFTYTWTGLQNGKEYRFFVYAVNGVGESVGPAQGGATPEASDDDPAPNFFKLWGKQTTYDKGLWYNWILLIVCFGWIWMIF